ncbi:hypothetical protein L5F46_05815 [Aliarcobacter butzleri]|uniref:hypothetical protein n=1 Tax=Aliarcobacter butzleri TaxID=28197 RepID=UPI001EDD8758|nr:hypothetical protein [Aliarcobacter butzleri]MCG3674291.1 hypothetical protein [Aliarcobacter butzleri]
MEKVKLKFYTVERCGYYKYGTDSNHLTNISDVLDDLKDWISDKTLSETKTTNVLTAATEKLPVYCISVEKSVNNTYLLVTWNEIASTNGNVASINKDEPIVTASSNVAQTSLPNGNIPGFATYFWFIPDENILATIKFGHIENGHIGMNCLLKGFLTRYSKYTVLREIPEEERDNESDEIYEILGYGNSDEPDNQLHPYFSSKLKRLSGKIDYIKNQRNNINKMIRKTTLTTTVTNELGLFEKLMYQIGMSTAPALNEKVELKYEIKTQPSSQELDDIISSWQSNHEQVWDDVGFVISGQPNPLWLSSEVPSKEIEINTLRNNDEFVNFAELLRELDRNKILLKRVYNGEE